MTCQRKCGTATTGGGAGRVGATVLVQQRQAVRASEVAENDRMRRTVIGVIVGQSLRESVQIWWKRCVDARSRMALQAAHCRD